MALAAMLAGLICLAFTSASSNRSLTLGSGPCIATNGSNCTRDFGSSPGDDHAAARGLAALPLAARAPVSAALGRDERSFGAREIAGVVTLSNSPQGLLARFGERGVQIRSGHARLGLSLAGYGYGKRLKAVGDSAPWANANRVVYRHSGVTEWYANGPLGIEQGFTLNAPRAWQPRVLTLALGLTGNLHAAVSGGTATFTGAGGALRYSGLVASDATGRRLAARLQLVDGRLLIRVDVAGARYPLTVDPFVQQAELTASDAAAGDGLGGSVAISGNTIVAGAPSATVNGNARQGAVYVFVEPSTGWGNATEIAKLTASDGAAGDELGASVAVEGNTIVAGASSATVNGNPDQGAVYAFVEPATGWANGTETAKLTASDGGSEEFLGYSVAISGKTIVAGACGRYFRGGVYVFVEPATGWASGTETAKLTASDSVTGFEFGASVAIAAGTIVAGAPGWGGADFRGAVYVFVAPPTGWVSATETAKLTASDGAAYDELGWSVAISGNTIAALTRPIVNPGAVYVFVEPPAGWADATETAKLTPSDGWGARSLAMAGNTIVAGASGETVDGNAGHGAVDVFVKPPAGWANGTETAKLIASGGVSEASLGSSVAMAGSTIVAGAPGATVDGNLHGALYGFVAPPPTSAIDLSPATPNGENGWYVSPVLIRVSASDSTDGLSTAATNCVLDRASPPMTFSAIPAGCAYTGSGADVTGNGPHTIYAASEDNAGDPGAPLSASFRIDRTPPTIMFTGNARAYRLLQTVAISCSATDGVSGIAAATCPNANGPAWTFGAGVHTLGASATDRAGNRTSAMNTFKVVVTAGPLCTLTTHLVKGSARYGPLSTTLHAHVTALVTGLCTRLARLTSKLTSAQKASRLEGYDRGVQALGSRGWLTRSQASILARLAAAL